MSFLGWLDRLSQGVDQALKAKRTVDQLVRVGHVHGEVTRPIREALEYVKGLKRDETKPDGGEAKEAPQTDKPDR